MDDEEDPSYTLSFDLLFRGLEITTFSSAMIGVSGTLCKHYLKENSIPVMPDFELGNIDLLIHFAKYDFGIACVIKNFIKDDLDNGRLYEIKPIERIPPRTIGAVWLKDVRLSTAANELIRHLDDIVSCAMGSNQIPGKRFRQAQNLLQPLHRSE
ncbi:MAG: hypothetical protein HPY74_17730 [Firmicutes bacterium]|nr:hypothetical protein [Bacillota bacterium]